MASNATTLPHTQSPPHNMGTGLGLTLQRAARCTKARGPWLLQQATGNTGWDLSPICSDLESLLGSRAGSGSPSLGTVLEMGFVSLALSSQMLSCAPLRCQLKPGEGLCRWFLGHQANPKLDCVRFSLSPCPARLTNACKAGVRHAEAGVGLILVQVFHLTLDGCVQSVLAEGTCRFSLLLGLTAAGA